MRGSSRARANVRTLLVMSDEAPWRQALHSGLADAGDSPRPDPSGPRFVSRPFGESASESPDHVGSSPTPVSRRGVVGVLLVVLAMAALAGAGAGWLVVALDEDPSPNVIADGRASAAALLERVRPAVVSISVTEPSAPGTTSAAGSGIVLTADGEVLTNAHVVRDASTILVRAHDRAQLREARLVAMDPAQDLALLRVLDADGWPITRLGRSAGIRVGDAVFAIGNAVGLDGAPSVTRGIVSALDRAIDTAAGRIEGLIQTDAAISSGNSGGALVDRRGEVVGVNTAVLASRGGNTVQGIGFAIPVDVVKRSLAVMRSG